MQQRTRRHTLARAAIAALVFALGASSLPGALQNGAGSQREGGNGQGEEHACLEPAGARGRGLECFESLGPIHFAGRVRALVTRPDDAGTIWAATASGG